MDESDLSFSLIQSKTFFMIIPHICYLVKMSQLKDAFSMLL